MTMWMEDANRIANMFVAEVNNVARVRSKNNLQKNYTYHFEFNYKIIGMRYSLLQQSFK